MTDRKGTTRLVLIAALFAIGMSGAAVAGLEGLNGPVEVVYDQFRVPTIIAQTKGRSQAVLTSAGEANLYLAWVDGPTLYHTSQAAYDCTDVALSHAGQVVFDIIRKQIIA